MKSVATRKKTPASPAEWEAVIAAAPGKDRALTAKEEAAMSNVVVVKTGGYSAATWRSRSNERSSMSLPVEDLEAQALSLPPEDRARLLERLIASFEPKSPAQAAWMQLAQRRREDVRSGRAQMVPGDEALARVRTRLA